MCRYFREAVLPIDPALAVQLAQEGPVEELPYLPLVWAGLSSQAAAALLLPGVSGRGQPPQEPGADAETIAGNRGASVTIKAPETPLLTGAFRGRSGGGRYDFTSGPHFTR